MRLLAALLIALAASLDAFAASDCDEPPAAAPAAHAMSNMEDMAHGDDMPCDCCGDAPPAGMDCQASCISAPILVASAPTPAALPSASTPRVRWSPAPPEARGPSPPRRPPRRLS